MTAGPVSAEFRLIVDCCRRAFEASDAPAPHPNRATIDWSRFAELARFHRVQGLVWHSLRSIDMPDEIANSLSGDAREIAARNLRIAAEGRDLREAFERAEIPMVFVKGLTVGALAYSRPMLKMAWDIDLLVDPARVQDAGAELAARGYQRTIPAPPADLREWHSGHKESVWARPDESLYVELHTQLANNRRLIPGIGIDSPTQLVEIAPGIALPTLARDELFAYLCVHGCSSAWFRLKWISDLAGLIHGCSEAEIPRLYDRSQQLGAGRASGQALLLADRLFDSLAGTGLEARLSADKSTRRLGEAAYSQLIEGREPTDSRFGTWRIHWTQLLLKPDLAFKLNEAARQISAAFD